jgi:hypothetical protein
VVEDFDVVKVCCETVVARVEPEVATLLMSTAFLKLYVPVC